MRFLQSRLSWFGCFNSLFLERENRTGTVFPPVVSKAVCCAGLQSIQLAEGSRGRRSARVVEAERARDREASGDELLASWAAFYISGQQLCLSRASPVSIILPTPHRKP
jgi:hypothetical protein